MTRTYGPLDFAFPDRHHWVLTQVLAERARTHADKVFMYEAEGRQRRWTFADVATSSANIAGNLQERGFEVGDRLGIMMANCPEYILAWFGATQAGVVEAPINPEYKGAFLEHAMSLLGPRAVVVDHPAIDALEGSRSVLADDTAFFVVGDDPAIVSSAIARLESLGWQASPFDVLLESRTPTPVDQRYWDLGAIISTSGTTGASKGVMMSHSQLYFFAEQTCNMARLTEDDTLMLALPLFHGNAQFMTAYPALIRGGSIVMFERFSPAKFIERIQAHGITYANLIGVMMDWIMQQPPSVEERPNTLRAVLSAPTPHELGAKFRERFEVEVIVEVFGQTEISLPVMAPYDNDRPPGAAGLLVDEFFEARIVDPESDEPVQDGEVGEFIVRPRLPWIVNSGYWRMPEATASSRRNMWFHTGDGLRRDADGWYYFVDRIKDALRRRGHNISSFEVENAIVQHPGVGSCAVIGVASEYEGGEDEVMAVVVREGDLDLAELARWAQGNMPKFLVPRYWREVDELPKTPSQKVRKELLRQEGLTAETYDADTERMHEPAPR